MLLSFKLGEIVRLIGNSFRNDKGIEKFASPEFEENMKNFVLVSKMLLFYAARIPNEKEAI